jgi:hypothetical protein
MNFFSFPELQSQKTLKEKESKQKTLKEKRIKTEKMENGGCKNQCTQTA